MEPYPIFMHSSLDESYPSFMALRNYVQTAVLVDNHTKKHCYPALKSLLGRHTLISIKSGETYKHLETCRRIWQFLTDKQFDRHALLINLGGGVIGDMGGFCAATYKRGIDFMQVPTTLLAQVDASVGGKLGIDFNGFKNHIGVFREPAAVLIATDFLKTLPEPELRSGFAEIIKHCLIADSAMWAKIRRRDLAQQPWAELVPHSVKIKQTVVAKDPTEKGERKILNFGHTIGHAVESYFLTQPRRKLLHGEAIAVGMIAESYLSHQKAGLSEAELAQIEEFMYALYGKVRLPDNEIDAIAQLTLQDKKNRAGTIRCVLLEKIGQPVYDQPVTLKEIKAALTFYRE